MPTSQCDNGSHRQIVVLWANDFFSCSAEDIVTAHVGREFDILFCRNPNPSGCFGPDAGYGTDRPAGASGSLDGLHLIHLTTTLSLQ